MKTRSFILLAAAVACCVIAGCHSSRLSSYPDFPERIKRLGSLGIISDCMIVQATRGDTLDKIDVAENKDIGVHILQECADTLREKGYAVGNTMLSSIGLLMKQDIRYRLVRSAGDREVADEALPLASAPFYVDQRCSRDSAFLARLAALYGALLNTRPKEEESRATVVLPEAAQIGKVVGGGALVVILAGGYNVPAAKGLAEPAQDERSLQRFVAMKSISHLSMLLFIIDSGSGEVIWDDRDFKNGGIVTAGKYSAMLSDILDGLP